MRSYGPFLLVLAACAGDGSPAQEQPQADAGEGTLDSAVSAADAAVLPDAAAPTDAMIDSAIADAGDPVCELGSASGELDVRTIQAKAATGQPAIKGEPLELTLTIENTGSSALEVTLTALLDSKRFSDFSAVPLASKKVVLCRGSNTVKLSGGPFLTNESNKKQYALGSGAYEVARVSLQVEGGATSTDDSFEGKSFSVATSNALLVPVVYDAGYFTRIMGNPSMTPEAYLTASFRRANEVFTPSGSDPDGPGTFKAFPGGFDEMMNVRHLFRAFPGFPGENTSTEGWCEDATAYAKQALGLAANWGSQPAETRPERHGFDYLLALTPDMGGGVACGWLDVQVSSLINNDLDRQQVVLVHETGHIFGAPHCDDVGNGSGGSLQGYVMCSGEKHAHYPANFVWHSTSRSQMHTHWN